jgi:hypothetical protein
MNRSFPMPWLSARTTGVDGILQRPTAREGRNVDGKPIIGGVVDNRGHMNWLNDDIASRSTEIAWR